MAHLHEVYDDDLYFSVDATSRRITHESDQPVVLIKGDHNSERFSFEIPRYIEGHDVMLCDVAQVHYMNIGSSGNSARSFGLYEITDMQVDPDDESAVLCSWLVSNQATMHVGSLNFVLRIACSSGSNLDYVWNTTVFSGITIADGIDNAEIIVDQYADIIQKWYMELVMAGSTGINAIKAAETEAIERIKEIDVIVQVEQETIDRIAATGDEVIDKIREEIYTGETALIDSIPVYTGEVEVNA